MKLKSVMRLHLVRELVDLLLTTLLPFGVMAQSAYANGWAFGSGNVDWLSVVWYWAFLRGLILEVLIFGLFFLVRHVVLRGRWYTAPLPFLVGVIAMFISASLNIAWANRSGEMQNVIVMVGGFLPDMALVVFKMGLGFLFPIAVASFALYDTFHLFHEAVAKSGRASELVMAVENADRHRELLRKEQEESVKEVKDQYTQMAKADAQNMVNRVRQGDYSFGLDAVVQHTQPLVNQSSVRRVTPVQPTVPLVSGPRYSQAPVPSPVTAQWNTLPPLQPNPYQR